MNTRRNWYNSHEICRITAGLRNEETSLNVGPFSLEIFASKPNARVVCAHACLSTWNTAQLILATFDIFDTEPRTWQLDFDEFCHWLETGERSLNSIGISETLKPVALLATDLPKGTCDGLQWVRGESYRFNLFTGLKEIKRLDAGILQR